MTMTDTPGNATPSGGPGGRSRDRMSAFLRTGTLQTAGELLRFAVRVVRELPATVKLYRVEVFRQAGIFILSNALVIWFAMAIYGWFAGFEANYLLKQIGAGSYAGFFNAMGDLKFNAQMAFPWMLAAKAASGMAAELGAMKINEEVDALDVIGLRSRSYLVGTRVLAFLIGGPFLYLVGVKLMFALSYVSVVYQFGTVSEGGYNDVFWSFQTPTDLLLSFLWALTVGIVVIIVGCYYGYTAKGGPVGVGQSAQKSIVANLTLIGILGCGAFQLVYGTSIVLPIAN